MTFLDIACHRSWISLVIANEAKEARKVLDREPLAAYCRFVTVRQAAEMLAHTFKGVVMNRLNRPVRRSAIVGVTVVLIVSGALLGVGGSAAHAAAFKPPKKLSHFLCYAATPTNGFQIPNVLLQNQFNTVGFSPSIVDNPLVHCNPVTKTVISATGKKTVYKAINTNAHLLCYPITAPTQPSFTVSVTNQFGTAQLVTGQPQGLCLPTWKSLTGPPNKTPIQPPKLSHFTCYPVDYAPGSPPYQPPANITLQDQFSPSPVSVQVGSPVELCVPTTKTVIPTKGKKKVYKMINPKAHLLCFEVTPTPFPPFVFDQNQFGTDQINLQQTAALCLPSFKTIIS